MTLRHLVSAPTVALVTVLAAATVLPGCAVTRGQQSVQSYASDSTITTEVKLRLADNKAVDATAISVETLKGEVLLSGFAKTEAERAAAEQLTWMVSGVKKVSNKIVVRAA